MADILSRILGPVAIPNGDSILFTGIAGHIYTVKQIVITNNTVSDVVIALGINGLTDDSLILPDSTVVAGGMAEFDGLTVWQGTDTFQARTSIDGLTITVSGLDQGSA
jgi:hypothetical protein